MWGEGLLEIDDKDYSVDEVIDRLTSLLTESRLARMDRVIESRTYNISPVLENIYDRGNTSAVMRSAEAFGFFHFNIIERPDQTFKVANRVTQGTDKWLEVRKHERAKTCVEQLHSEGFQVFATHLEAARPIDEIDFTKPTALVFGNEREGVSREMIEACDGTVIIPMQGFAQSFNISVAAAVSFYHIFKARERELGHSGDLTDVQKKYLRAMYMARSCESASQVMQL